MSRFEEIQSADGFRFPAYLARPEGQPKAAIIVLQEIFGVNSHIRSVADRLAEEGFWALAPSTFARVKPDVELGYTENDVAEGFGIKTATDALPAPGVLGDIQASIDFAQRQNVGKVGITGFCWGGLLTWRAAAELTGLSAAVAYYGGGITTEAEAARTPKVPVLAHFADQDHWIPLESVETFRQRHPEAEVHVYPADHGFNCDQRGSYNEAAATQAWERTLQFFNKHLA